MAKNQDGVVIHRIPNPKNSGNNKDKKKTEEKKTDTEKFDRQFNKNIKLLALCIMLFAFFIFLSLISYTPADEAFLDIKAKDLIGLIKGNESIIARAEMTNNWLGLVGAFISNYLYNYTFGFAIMILPLILVYWGYELFKYQKISEKALKYTMLTLILGLIFSGIMGVTAKMAWFPNMPKELYGIAGYYTASLLYSIIGGIGSLLFFAVSIFATLYYGFGMEFHRTKSLLNKASEIEKDDIKEKFAVITSPLKKIYDYTKRDSLVGTESTANEKETVQTVQNIPDEDEENNGKEESEKKQKERPEIKSAIPEFEDGTARLIRQNLDYNRKNVTEDIIDDYIDENEPFIGIRDYRIKYDEPIPAENKTQFRENTTVNTDDEAEIALNNQDNYLEDEIPAFSKLVEIKIEKRNISDDGTDDDTDADDENANINDDNDYSENVSQYQEIDEIPEDIEEVNTINVPVNYNHNSVTKDKALNIYLQEPVENEVLNKIPKSPISTASLDEKIKYVSPTVDLLSQADESLQIDENELKENAKILQEKLETFKIYIENLTITPGPVVTQYEFVPAAGIKISKIANLADDISMALKARGIRIIAPIPGKGTVGIEIPNQTPLMVKFSSIVKSTKFHNNHFSLPLALGKTISGEVYIVDLAKMPHLLIAGSTGSGKSVGINTVIASLLYKLHPRDLKFVIIDPKKVELRQYEALENHFLALSPDINDTIITDPQDAVIVLKALCAEMDKRYDILASVGQRNIFDYNNKVGEGKIKDTDEVLHRRMPFIVCIVDELADLMLTASKEVETPIIRLAQLARAVGIHLVVATQRPSVNVITGIIKANFPARVSYLVASKIDSRTILDVMGAEKLLGNGDMLFLAGGSPKPIRVQNAFISTDEVESLCEFIGQQKGFSEPYYLPSIAETVGEREEINPEDRDPLFEEAARLVVRNQTASVSLVQRRLKVGYARAGRIIDELEAAGIVGPFDGSKSRNVFLESEMELESYL